MRLRDQLVDAWYHPRLLPLTWLLLPLSWIYAGVTEARRALYRAGWLRSFRFPVPVIVVGNITAGGTGKTPLVLALADMLAAHGRKPGVVSRGHGGRRAAAGAAPIVLTPQMAPNDIGDEPALIARSGIPVAIGRDRAGAVRALLAAHPEVDVVLADDGLQHYALKRNIEIAVIDAFRGIGNGHLLPAGPLREPARRLGQVDAIVRTEGMQGADRDVPRTIAGVPLFSQSLVPGSFRRVNANEETATVQSLRRGRVHALAGIGNPGRFFATLSALGIDATAHVFPDHHAFRPEDLELPNADVILMTEKDAVKCVDFADARCWYLPVRARVDPALLTLIEDKLRGSQAA